MRRRILLSSGHSEKNYGTGTESDPFLIYTSDDLLLVESFLTPANEGGTAVYPIGEYHGVTISERFVGQYLKLANDIDLSNVCGSGIGNFPAGHLFGGDFNGDNHIISNLYNVTTNTTAPTAYSTANKGGLFYSLSAGARLHNVIFDGFTIRAYYAGIVGATWSACQIDHIIMRNGSFYPNMRGSGVLGYASTSSPFAVVEHCICESTVTFSSGPQGYCEVGAIVGWARGCIIRYCINLADISGNHFHIGGIAGGTITNSSTTGATVINCINFGKIRSSATLSGCIMGNADYSTLRYNMNCGWLNSTSECSGILGYKSNGTTYVDGCLNIGVINPYGSTSRVNPIAVYGSPTRRYNYYTPETSDVTGTTSGVVIQISQSDLICTTDNTKPSSITDSTYWNTTNWVFKKGYYPYPKGIENTDACLCAAAPIIFQSGDKYSSITDVVTFGTEESYADGISWVSSDSSKLVITASAYGSGTYIYEGTPIGTGSVTVTNYKNGKAYKKVNLNITGTV